MAMSTLEEVDLVSLAIETPTLTVRELHEATGYEPALIREALRRGAVAINWDVLSCFGMEDGPRTRARDELACAVVADKWPEATYADIAAMLRAVRPCEADALWVERTIREHGEYLRGDRAGVEAIEYGGEDGRRALHFANKWPDLDPMALGAELGLAAAYVTEVISRRPDQLTGERAERQRDARDRLAWERRRAARVVDCALAHPTWPATEVAWELGVPTELVQRTLHRHAALFKGLPERPRPQARSYPMHLELEDVERYVDAIDRGEQARLPRTARRF